MHRFLKFFKGLARSLKESSVEILNVEYIELENAFLTLIFGTLVGIPTVPLGLSMELAPLLRDELRLLEDKHRRRLDVLADLFSSMGGEW